MTEKAFTGREAATTVTATQCAYQETVVAEVITIKTNDSDISGRYVRLDSGGYRSTTTKRRMSQFLRHVGAPWKVYQKSLQWFATGDDRAPGVPFKDGIALSLDFGGGVIYTKD